MSASDDIEFEFPTSQWDDDIISCLTHYGDWVKFDNLMSDLEISLVDETKFINALRCLSLKKLVSIRTNKTKTSKLYRIKA